MPGGPPAVRRVGQNDRMADAAAALRKVNEWFAAVGYAGLVLPSGWFGRPYDNWHELTWACARSTKLLVELDGQLLLVLTEPGVPQVEGPDLVLPCAQLVFDWQGYGDLIPHAESFGAGSLRLVDSRSFFTRQ